MLTHDQEEAMAISDRIAVMQGGRIVQFGTAEMLYRHPASSFVAGFLGHANILRGVVREAADRSITIELAGQPITLPTTQAIPAKTKVTAVIRPEAISIATAGDGVRAKLTGRVYLGEKVEYTVEIGGVGLQIVRSDSPEGEALTLGEDVLIRFPNTGIHLLVEGD